MECGCIDGYELNLEKTECVRTIYTPTATPVGAGHEVDTPLGKLRLVNGEGGITELRTFEGACLNELSGRVELFLNDAQNKPEWVGISEPRENQWFTIEDFDENAGEYICRTIFGQYSDLDFLIPNSQCGTSESRVWKFNCNEDSFESFDRSYPDGCSASGPYAGCSTPGCEFEAPFGFPDTVLQIDQHSAVQCRCIDGFELNPENTECIRIVYLPTETPTGVSHEVDTDFGKLRLVADGICENEMSGRIELQVDNAVSRPEWTNITESRDNQWFTLSDTGFDTNAANYTCQTMFGPLAELVAIVHDSKCGKSESRVWAFSCDSQATVGNNGKNFPVGCQSTGPFAGCTTPGCEFDANHDFPGFGFPDTVEEIDQHAAVICKCRAGHELNSTTTECMRKVFPTTPTPIDVPLLDIENAEHGIRMVPGQGLCDHEMSGRVEVLVKNLADLAQFENIAEIQEGMWFSVADEGFGTLEGENLCKAFFGYGSTFDEIYSAFITMCLTPKVRQKHRAALWSKTV